MKMPFPIKFQHLIILIVLLSLILACSMPGTAANPTPAADQPAAGDQPASSQQTPQVEPPTATPQDTALPPTETVEPAAITPTPTATQITHSITPGNPGWVTRWFTDSDSSRTAGERRAAGGDFFDKNIYERPFSQTSMDYRPDLDLTKAEISSDTNFVYVTLYLAGLNPQSNNLTGLYGVEVDTDLDGRGDYLVLVNSPASTTWAVENVTAYKDSDNNVGGSRPMRSDAPAVYDGYDQVVFSLETMPDPDAAWGRVSPKGSAIVEIAFKRTVVGGSNAFLWSVWADDGVKDPKKLDYNDHFTSSEAGSPYTGAGYPLAALFQVDSTCREVFNAVITGNEPGLCSTPTPTPVPTATLPQATLLGAINGLVFADNNGNGRQDAGDAGFLGGNVSLASGTCASPTSGWTNLPVSSSGSFGASGLAAGNYCVTISTAYTVTTARDVNVNLTSGGTVTVLFGLQGPG